MPAIVEGAYLANDFSKVFGLFFDEAFFLAFDWETHAKVLDEKPGVVIFCNGPAQVSAWSKVLADERKRWDGFPDVNPEVAMPASQFAGAFGFSLQDMLRLAEAGELPSPRRIRGCIYFDRKTVIAWGRRRIQTAWERPGHE
ncbi:hypothetical protein [Acidimangrovimonas pyrenivorans]|uniref:Helix-turn-helix domain-containing protein n=1 Tax=Acidimangrovimonas pyrenivorans TaxID=2030798 RepID=A0ABV7ACY2_9RHOB